MLKKTFPNFSFSPTISIVSLLLAIVMVRCSLWQWERYHYKLKLLETYSENSVSMPLPFPSSGTSAEDFSAILHRKVRLSGRYDFSRQLIIANQRHETGPGYWLMTPLQIDGSERYVLVSRGFIPFVDRTRETWEKYNFSSTDEFDAVVQPTVPHRSFLAPDNPDIGPGDEFNERWLYPDLAKMKAQFPYEIITNVFVQRLGPPPHGLFPAESITVHVPPSTHFGYTFEWLILAAATLAGGFLLQAYPRKRRGKDASVKRDNLRSNAPRSRIIPSA